MNCDLWQSQSIPYQWIWVFRYTNANDNTNHNTYDILMNDLFQKHFMSFDTRTYKPYNVADFDDEYDRDWCCFFWKIRYVILWRRYSLGRLCDLNGVRGHPNANRGRDFWFESEYKSIFLSQTWKKDALYCNPRCEPLDTIERKYISFFNE